MRMKLWAGRVPNIGTEVIFNIFDLLPEQYTEKGGTPISVSQYDISVTVEQGQPAKTYKTLYFTKTDSTYMPFLFPANIPRQCTDEDNIIQVSGGMTFDDTINAWTITDTDFEEITGGDEPDDWKTARFEYYYKYNGDSAYSGFPFKQFSNCRTDEYTQANYNYVYGFDVTTGTVYDSSATYYHNANNDPRKNLCQLYTAATGSSFGIWRNFNTFGAAGCGIGNIWTEFADTITNNYGVQTPFFYAPFGQNPYSYYYGKNIKNLYLSESPVYTAEGYKPISQSASITIFVSYVYNDVTYYGMALVSMSGTGADAYPIAIQAQLFSAEFWGDSIISGGSSGGNWGADTVISGGNGTFTADSNTHGDGTGADIGNKVNTLNGAATIFTAGGINVYKIATQGSAVTIATIIGVLFSDDFLLKFKNYMYNPLSSILSAHLLPNKLVSLTGGARSLTAGGFNISDEIAALSTVAIANQFTWLHVGKISVDLFSDSYADYAPYTSMRLHLPYIGEIDIDVNKCMNGQLSVDYVCDSISGNVAAFVWVKDKDGVCTYAYTATGNAAYSYPMFSESQSGAAVGKLIGATASGVVGIATGNPLGILGAAMGGIDAVMQQRNTQVSGTFTGNVGALIACFADGLCFVDITRPVWANPSNFAELKGLISNLAGTLNDSGDGTGYAGFVRVSDCDLDGIAATETEKTEIENLLKNGIFVVVEE